jgi:hypothetical protein
MPAPKQTDIVGNRLAMTSEIVLQYSSPFIGDFGLEVGRQSSIVHRMSAKVAKVLVGLWSSLRRLLEVPAIFNHVYS